MTHKLVKDGRITLLDKTHKPTKSRFSDEDLLKLEKTLKETAKLQEELGLGIPDASSATQATAKMKQHKQIDRVIGMNKEYNLVHLADKDLLPQFFNVSGDTANESSGTRFEKGPEVVIMKLGSKVRKIRCNGKNSKDFEANIPMIPPEGVRRAQEIKQLDESIEFYLAFMPSWEPVPQRDPILLAKLDEEFIKIYEWGGDKDYLNSILPKKG